MEYLNAVMTLMLVIALMLALLWLLKKIQPGAMTIGMKGNNKRLALKEMIVLDHKRRACILSCDDSEYFVILGAQDETVVEKLNPPQKTKTKTKAA